MKAEDIRKAVRDRYGEIAVKETSCCGPAKPCCGNTSKVEVMPDISRKLGYSDQEIEAVPQGANLGLGCGNPTALATLKEGEIVLDLGSGAGFDVFLAAREVGKTGKVIGVDMTPEMIAKARRNAENGEYGNVEFRLGEIESLPVENDSVDVVISNCVVNLAPDKRKVFREAFRVLRSGGRIMVSDLVLLRELPEFIKNSLAAVTGCIAGALEKEDYLGAIRAAGFSDVRVVEESVYPIAGEEAMIKAISGQFKIPQQVVEKAACEFVSSIKVYALKA